MLDTFLNSSSSMQIAIILGIISVILLLRLFLNHVFSNLFKIDVEHVIALKQRNQLINYITIIVLTSLTSMVLSDLEANSWLKIVDQILNTIIILCFYQILRYLIKLIQSFYGQFNIAKERSIKPIIQLAQLILAIVLGLSLISLWTNTNPIRFIAGATALSAVIGLIFKDIILAFYAGLYLTSTEMIHLGDFVSIDKNSVNGIVEDIGMSHVTLRNLDNSTTTIPSYEMLQSEMRNQASIKPGNGYRIKRSLLIDPKKVTILAPDEKQELITKYDLIDKVVLNTNVDLLIETIIGYIKRHQSVDSTGTLSVYLGDQEATGVRLEIVCSTKIATFSDFKLFESHLLSMIMFYVNHFELNRD